MGAVFGNCFAAYSFTEWMREGGKEKIVDVSINVLLALIFGAGVISAIMWIAR